MTPRNDYSDWSKEDLIRKIKTLEKRKKYGLVWDTAREPEQVVLDCQNELPVLKEIKDKEVQSFEDDVTHILIEGDNYHALSVLNYTHEKAVDLIYIDPPYNTGAQDWLYNNKFVDANDAYRHSKWLSMMDSRLRLAKHLLNTNGVLIVTIDDNELCTLGLLLDEIFPSKERATVVIKYNPAGTARNGFSRNHEYAFFLLNHGQEIEKKPAPPDVRDQNLRRHGNGANRQDSPTMFYPIFVDKNNLKVTGVGTVPAQEFHPASQTIDKDDYYEVWPLDDRDREKRWYYGRERVQLQGSSELQCKWVNNRLHVYFHTDNLSEQKYQSVWIGSEYDAGAHGGSLVRDIVGKEFPFPKSVYAVRDCLSSIIRNKLDATVLDFFAGSGTTGHALMLLNKEDGGRRRFILCTNNENNICTEVCYPRVEKVIKGYENSKGEAIEGLGGNLKYYQTAFVPASPTDKNKELLTKQSIEMLTLKEGTFEKMTENPSYSVYRNSERYTGIIFDQLSFAAFKKAVAKVTKPISLYIFSLADEDFSDDFADMKGLVKISAIPESILRVYRRIFR